MQMDHSNAVFWGLVRDSEVAVLGGKGVWVVPRSVDGYHCDLEQYISAFRYDAVEDHKGYAP